MASKDIEKLKEKFEKDPNSKLFLPLAEEYRKESMLDEAIEVLQTGLEKHQAYTSARVLLGKIYLEKGMLGEARIEFENVIASVPDNLFAHKKLADIYRDTGEKGRAITALQAILRLNPMDEETLNSLKALESGSVSGSSEQVQVEATDTDVELKMPEENVPGAAFPEHGSEEIGREEISREAEGAQPVHSEEELNAFKDSLFGGKGTLEDDAGRAAVEDEQFPEEITLEDETIDESEQDLTFGDVAAEVGQEERPAAGGYEAEILQDDESADLRDDLLDADEDMPQPESDGHVLEDADRFVAEGNFSTAMGIYRKYLTMDPGDKVVLQRVNELKALLKLLGKDKEVLIAKLDAFLEGIHKRRDEFLGRS